jgi:SAM-dependent methyltransferase
LKRYDRRYFDRWYRSARWQVVTGAELARRARMVIALSEYLLERPVANVLDVGCGEGAWYAALRALRPRIRYLGLDPSPYVVQRFGARRHIRSGSFELLGDLRDMRPFDLVLCVDVLHYLPSTAIEQGLAHLGPLTGGLAYLPVFASGDAFEGDRRELRRRPAAYYRRAFAGAGLRPCGPHCYASSAVAERATALELL